MTVRRFLGLDTNADRYAYGMDPALGYVSAQKIADHWVPTTCGYCSVGCGMFIGVKDGRAVSVRGNPDHPVNRGMLCPKGLSEHHTLGAANRARFPLLKQEGRFVRTSWAEAVETMATRFRDVQSRYGRDAVGVISTGQLVTEEFYTLGKLVQLGLGTSQLRRQHHALHVDRRGRVQTVLRQRRSAWSLRGSRTRRRHPADRRQHRGQPSDPLPAAGSQSRRDADRRRSPCDQDGDAGRHPPADPPAIGPRPHQWSDPHHHRARRRRLRLRRCAYHRLRPAEGLGRDVYAATRLGDYRHQPRTALRDGGALLHRRRRLHRVDDGRQPQHEGDRNRQRHQQPRADYREHRPGGRGAVLDHRSVQRDGHPRGGLRFEPSRVSRLRESGASRRAGGDLERSRGARARRARPRVSRHHRGGARQADPRALDHRHQSHRLVSEPRRVDAGARGAGIPRRPGRLPSDAHDRARTPRAAGRHLG